MSSILLKPRVSPAQPAFVGPRRSRAVFGYVLFSSISLGSFVGAIGSNGVLYPAFLASMGLVMAIFVPYLRALAIAAQAGVIRVQLEGTLCFLPPLSLNLLPNLISIVALIPGVLSFFAYWWTSEEFASGQGSVWPRLAFGFAVLWLVQQFLGRRVPLGLMVSAWGLVGVRGVKSVQIPWEDLEAAEVEVTSKGARLRLVAKGIPVVAINPAYFGSDPNLVAVIIEFYRTHPKDRGLLGEPRAAVRQVEYVEHPRAY